MTDTIHPAWLRPMPKYWWDFYERDHALLDADTEIPGHMPGVGEPRNCIVCDQAFVPDVPQANHRRVCYSLECEKERKRRNGTASARRVAARKRAQQA